MEQSGPTYEGDLRTERLDMGKVQVQRSDGFRQVYASVASLTGLPNEVVVVFGSTSVDLRNPNQPILIQEFGATMSYAHAEALATRLQIIVDQHKAQEQGSDIIVPAFRPPRGGVGIS